MNDIERESWKTWASQMELWILEIARSGKLDASTADCLIQLLDWKLLNKDVIWVELMDALKEKTNNQPEGSTI